MSILDAAKKAFNIPTSGSSLKNSSKNTLPPQPVTGDDGIYSVTILVNTKDYDPVKKELVPKDYAILARLPESFKLDVKSDWEPLTSGISGMAFKAADLGAQALLGYTLKSQILSSQYWTGNSPIDFSLPLQFKAFYNASKEVMNPIKDLMKSTLPTRGANNFLRPPGPNIMATSFQNVLKAGVTVGKAAVNAAGHLAIGDVNGLKDAIASDLGKAGDQLGNLSSSSFEGTNIQLTIGKFFHINNLIITDVSGDFKSIMSTDNTPMSGECTISFRTLYAFTANDLENCFTYNGKI